MSNIQSITPARESIQHPCQIPKWESLSSSIGSILLNTQCNILVRHSMKHPCLTLKPAFLSNPQSSIPVKHSNQQPCETLDSASLSNISFSIRDKHLQQHPCQSLISASLSTFYPASMSNTPFSIPVNSPIQHPHQFSNPRFLAFPAFHNQQSQHAHLSYGRPLSNAGALHNWPPDNDLAVEEKIKHSCHTPN